MKKCLTKALCLIAALAATHTSAYEIAGAISYSVGSNTLHGESETSREALDFDQYNCGHYVYDDLFGYYCEIWLLSLNDPYVDAYTVSPSNVSTLKGSDEDTQHAEVSYNVSPSEHGLWTARGEHFVHQKGFVMYCPYGMCGGWIPATHTYTSLGVTEPQHSPIFLDIWRHPGTALSSTQVDTGILPDATTILQTNDGSGDVACPMTFRRDGAISNDSVGDGEIDDQAEQDQVIDDVPERVRVVGAINWCNGPVGPNTVGCSAGAGMILERVGSLEGMLWAHEYGHNQDLWLPISGGHRTNSYFLGYDTLVSTARRVSQSECDVMRDLRWTPAVGQFTRPDK